MSPSGEALIRKAWRSVASSRRQIDDGDFDFAISRAYYAMFYATQALLLSHGLTFAKHSAVIGAFGQHFVKPGLFDPSQHEALRAAFDARSIGDYEDSVAYTAAEAESFVSRAEHFIREIERHLTRSNE